MLLLPNLSDKVCIVTGATRGIGRECVLGLARQGCNIVVTGKSVTEKPNLPGSIYSVSREVEALGVKALPFRIDVRDESTLEACVAATMKKFGRIDILINNASALWWHKIVDTPMKKYDLINSVNARGTFLMTRLCLPHMEKGGYGRVITMSPPISPVDAGTHTAYLISKWGMTLTAMGVAKEYKGRNITGNSLWPATVIESQASINFKLGKRENWRKPSILVDCVLSIIADGTNGQMLFDEDYLLSKGLRMKDLDKYSCVPGGKLVYIRNTGKGSYARGDIRKVKKDRVNDTFSKL